MQKIYYHGKELYSPKLDLVFKALFGREDSKDILRSFLNSVLDLDIKSADDITLTNTEMVPEIIDGKLSRLDVCAKVRNATEHDDFIDVEIQLCNEGNIINRSVYYVSRLFTSQLSEGDSYNRLGRAIGLSILDFSIFEDDKWSHRGRLKDVENNQEFTDCFELNFVEIPKLPKSATDTKELWLHFLNATTEKEMDMLVNQNAEIAHAIGKLERISNDSSFQHQLMVREKTDRDYINAMETAKERGILRGREEGMQQGMQQGVYQTTLKVARGMLERGIDIATIMQVTGLTESEIEKL